jgi:N-glycosylase/DNA lyase
LVHRISSVGRGQAPFPLDIPVPVKRRLNRRLSRVSAWNVVLNDIK